MSSLRKNVALAFHICVEARKLVDKQAADESLWFKTKTAPEAHLQKALRELHRIIEEGE